MWISQVGDHIDCPENGRAAAWRTDTLRPALTVGPEFLAVVLKDGGCYRD